MANESSKEMAKEDGNSKEPGSTSTSESWLIMYYCGYNVESNGGYNVGLFTCLLNRMVDTMLVYSHVY
uniref:Uncharacterized protein n=1 Tax=Arundo donax TaxID=35708 RepID=A0A0A9F4P9_ARUDO